VARETELRWQLVETGDGGAQLEGREVDLCQQETTTPQIYRRTAVRTMTDRSAWGTVLGYTVGPALAGGGVWALAEPCTFADAGRCTEEDVTKVQVGGAIAAAAGGAMLIGAVVNSIRAIDSTDDSPANALVVRAGARVTCGMRPADGIELELRVAGEAWSMHGATDDSGTLRFDLAALAEAHPMAQQLDLLVAGAPVQSFPLATLGPVATAREAYEAAQERQRAAERERAAALAAERARAEAQEEREQRAREDLEARSWPKLSCDQARVLVVDAYEAIELSKVDTSNPWVAEAGRLAAAVYAESKGNAVAARMLEQRAFFRRLPGEAGTCRIEPRLLPELQQTSAKMQKYREVRARISEEQRRAAREECVVDCMRDHLSAREENCRMRCGAR
jgi:hypothetical protein